MNSFTNFEQKVSFCCRPNSSPRMLTYNVPHRMSNYIAEPNELQVTFSGVFRTALMLIIRTNHHHIRSAVQQDR